MRSSDGKVAQLAPRRGAPRRIATLSVHTSPLHQPGTGDAGGMNVYIVEMSKRLAALGIEVEIFTRATSSDLPPIVEMAPGVLVRHVNAGPYEGLVKEDLPSQLCAFTSGVLRTEAMREPGYYDLVHSHYWLSGQVGWLAKERWGVPLVHTMHTMAKVKNLAMATGDAPEPSARVIGEQQVVAAADRLVANTPEEAEQLIELYEAEPEQVAVVNPGVDLETFRPDGPTGAASMAAARRRLGLPQDAHVMLFAGRIQPLKAPDIVLYAAAELLRTTPSLRDKLVVAVVGGPSGNGLAEPAHLQKLAASLGLQDVVRFTKPVPQDVLADWYRAATVAVVPSYNESFGLVAIEAQASGTPVIAAEVGGLSTAVRDGFSGTLVAGHNPADYATALRPLLESPRLRDVYARAAVQHAAGFGWPVAAASMADVYAQVLARPAVAEERMVAGR